MTTQMLAGSDVEYLLLSNDVVDDACVELTDLVVEGGFCCEDCCSLLLRAFRMKTVLPTSKISINRIAITGLLKRRMLIIIRYAAGGKLTNIIVVLVVCTSEMRYS